MPQRILQAGSPCVLVTDAMMFRVFLIAAVIAVPAVAVDVGGRHHGIANLAGYINEASPQQTAGYHAQHTLCA